MSHCSTHYWEDNSRDGSRPTKTEPDAAPPTDADMARWLGLFAVPGSVLEIRAPKARLKPGSSRTTNVSRFFGADQLLEAAQDALRLSGRAPGVYVTLNPIDQALKGGTRAAADKDVVRRRRMLIDCDPGRDPAAVEAARQQAKAKGGEYRGISATDAEKARARATALAIRDHLRAEGWPEPILADSGNGWHLIHAIDLPADDQELVKRCLKALAARVGSAEVDVDTTVFNPSRIVKCYGTRACKGEPTAERPHRFSRVVEIPEPLEPVASELLEALADEPQMAASPKAEPAPEPAASKRKRTSGGSDARWTPEARAAAYLERCDPAVAGQKGHNQTFAVACKIGPGFDLPQDIALRLMRAYNERCQPPWSDKDLEHKVADAYTREPQRGWLLEAERSTNGAARKPSANGRHQKGGASLAAAAADDRVDIEVTTRWYEVMGQTLPTLRRDPDLYRRGDVLVTVAVETEDEIPLGGSTVLKGMAGTPRVIALSPANLGCRLTKVASFYQWMKDKSGELQAVTVRPPQWLIEAVATHCHYPGVRLLLAVVECPYPRLDGSIVETPGYDPTTGTIFRPSMKFSGVPDRPTKEQAQDAAKRLLAIVRQFPFQSDADRAVWLAALLTVIARPIIDGPVPGFALNGNKAGVGKGLLIDVIGIIGTNRCVPTSTYPEEKEEAAKVKVSIALAGPPVIHFDNLDEGSFYGNSAFDSAITSKTVNDRILGSSKHTGDIALRSTFFLSGNNVSPGKDAYRRWLPCNLVTDLERPEERDDIAEHELERHVMEHRGEYVRDALIILGAHARDGYPDASKAPLGSFGQWDRIVRGAVIYAYGIDPCQTRRKAADEAPARQAKVALLEGWKDLPGGTVGGLTTAEAIEQVVEHPDDYDTLRNALLHFGRDGKLATARSLGNTIRGMKGCTIEKMRFLVAGDKHRAILWKVDVTTGTTRPTGPNGGASGESDESGESAFPPTRVRIPSDEDANTCVDRRNETGYGVGETHQTHQTHRPTAREVREL